MFYIRRKIYLLITKITPKMTIKNLLKPLFLSLVAVTLFSCGGSDDGSGSGSGSGSGGEEVVTTSITISANVNTIELGESVAFLVKDNNYANKTALSTIFVGGTEMSGSVFTPSLIGTYEAYATFEGFTSPTISIIVEPATIEVVIVGSEPYFALPGETFTFSAFANGSTNVTDDATFSVDGTEIADNTFVSSERGNFAVTAVYESVDSNEITIAAGYEKKVLVEDYTGTWCGYCPRLAYNLEQAETDNDDIYGVAVHNGDAMTYEYEGQMRSRFGVSGFPTGKINRTTTWNESVNQLLSSISVSPTLGLGLDSSLSGTLISVDVKVGYIAATTDMKLIIYLVEDGLIYNQVNYMNNDSSSPWYQTGNPIVGFEHNNVLRKAFTDIFGDAIPNGTVDGEYTETFTLEMPSSIQNENELQIIAFVVDDSDTVINAMRVDLGESQDYE
jgi:thiol-disulfide isomerase/thioredoxin